MKKLSALLLISLLFGINTPAAAQTFRRTEKQPNFFMPQALKKDIPTEKLPPIEMMNYQGRQAPSVVAAQQQAALEAERQHQAQLEKQKKKDETATAALLKTATKKTTATAPVIQTSQPETPVIKQQTTSQELTPFERSFQEYQKDLQGIRQGQTPQNHRIVQMLSDYQDIDRIAR